MIGCPSNCNVFHSFSPRHLQVDFDCALYNRFETVSVQALCDIASNWILLYTTILNISIILFHKEVSNVNKAKICIRRAKSNACKSHTVLSTIHAI